MIRHVAITLVCLFALAWGRPRQGPSAHNCSDEILALRRQQKLSHGLLQTLSEKLDTVIRVLEEMQQNFVHESMCGPMMCSGNGNCSLNDDMSGYSCICNPGFYGEGCDETRPCTDAMFDFHNSPPMPGKVRPICDETGFFAPVQFSGSEAICVDEHGNWLGFGVPRWEAMDSMDCACAREGGVNCNADGSYYVESESDDNDYDNGDDWLSFSYYG